MTREWTATITNADVRFDEQARAHYRLFAETLEKNGEVRSAGACRSQEFYAERFLVRISPPQEG
ncbi:MAG TPA: hypothetical protein VNA25_06005 [Phycisphaerae bacterium]|nr:hypothetical protein [Phycisphaerae bacterium]